MRKIKYFAIVLAMMFMLASPINAAVVNGPWTVGVANPDNAFDGDQTTRATIGYYWGEAGRYHFLNFIDFLGTEDLYTFTITVSAGRIYNAGSSVAIDAYNFSSGTWELIDNVPLYDGPTVSTQNIVVINAQRYVDTNLIYLRARWINANAMNDLCIWEITKRAIPEGENVILNGDFSTDLDFWTFEDASELYNCPPPYAEAYSQDGHAVIHGYSCTSDGRLHQYFDPMNPSYFSVEYDLDGNCSWITMDLYNLDERVLSFRAYRDTLLGRYRSELTLHGTYVLLGALVDPGKLEVYFDYDNMKVDIYLNNQLKGTLSISDAMIVDKLTLLASNRCHDGRNDVYGYFDNVVLFFSDSDGDGIQDNEDNCPMTSNPDQLNNDGDSQGDICDPDDDNDGVLDEGDYCPFEDATGFDADMDGCIDSPSGLIDVLETLVGSGVIDEQLENSLTSKVDNVEQSADKDNICAAINQLEAFKNQIEAQRNKKISEEGADLLIAYADNLITQLLNLLPEGESC